MQSLRQKSKREGQHDDFRVADIKALAHVNGFCSNSPSDFPICSLVRLPSPSYTLCSIRGPVYHTANNSYKHTPGAVQTMGISRDCKSLGGDGSRLLPVPRQVEVDVHRTARTRCERVEVNEHRASEHGVFEERVARHLRVIYLQLDHASKTRWPDSFCSDDGRIIGWLYVRRKRLRKLRAV